MTTKTYIGTLLGSMMLAACVSEGIIDDIQSPLAVGLTAYVDNGSEPTRMVVSDLGETSPGEEGMNENRLRTIDAFFYTHAADMTESAVYHVFDKVDQQTNWRLTRSISESALKTIFGVETLTAGAICQVYILANYGDNDGQSKFNGTESRDTLRQLKLESDFNRKENGAFIPQDDFVMEGTAAAELTGQGIFTLTGQVPLRRVAAKVRLAVTIDPDAEAGVTDGNGNVWVPKPNTMQVMLTHGVNKGIVSTDDSYLYDYPAGDQPIYFPKETEEEDVWSTYGRKMDQTTTVSGATWFEHKVPFYSYRSLNWKTTPDNEAYLSLSMRWVHRDDETKGAMTYYQIPIAQRLSEPSLSIKSYRYYRTEIKLGVMGSFDVDDPVTLTENSYIIVDWAAAGIDDTNPDNADIKPSMSEVAFLAVEANRDTLRNITSHGVAYASSHEITSAYVTKVEYVNTSDFTHKTIDNTTDTDGTLTVNTYVTDEEFTVTTENDYLTLSHNISPSQYTKYDVTVRITNAAGLSEDVIFTIYPAIYADKEDGDNAFINGRFGHVYDAAHGTSKSWSSRGNGFYSWYNKSSYVYTGTSNSSDTSPYGSLRSDAPSLIKDLTRITVTSFSADDETFKINNTNYTFQITDPRVASVLGSGTNLADYIVTAQSGVGTTNNYLSNSVMAKWSDLGKTIMVGTTAIGPLAPELLVSSGWGRTSGQGQLNFENSQKRCATYQEAGYPAGRWRLPTEAELMFIYKLQSLGVINTLFESTVSYWASSGRVISGYSNGSATFSNSTSTNASRCVYDVWYWGEPMSTNEYHAEP